MRTMFFSLCLATFAAVHAQSYTTNFPLNENPISEGGKWENGGDVGLAWHNVKTSGGIAKGLPNYPNWWQGGNEDVGFTGLSATANAPTEVLSISGERSAEVITPVLDGPAATAFDVRGRLVPWIPTFAHGAGAGHAPGAFGFRIAGGRLSHAHDRPVR